MDRFIDNAKIDLKTFCDFLKSNMDRFIVRFEIQLRRERAVLKSNMDRFIASDRSKNHEN